MPNSIIDSPSSVSSIDFDDVVDRSAGAGYEAVRVFLTAIGAGEGMPDWAGLADDQKQLGRRAAIGILRFGNGPREAHTWWLSRLVDEGGWSRGPVRDFAKKTHPCFVHWDDLQPTDRERYRVFVTVVIAVGVALGYSVRG